LLADIGFSDPELQRCFDEQVDPGLVYASQVHFLDCANWHAGAYTVASISDIGQLLALEYIGLGGSGVTDFVPLSELKSLAYLAVENIPFSDADLAFITHPDRNLHRLNNVSVGGSNVTDLGPLGGVINLQQAHLWGSQAFDLSPLFGLPLFNGVAMSRSQLTDISDLSVANLPGLRNLWLHGALAAGDMSMITSRSDLWHLSIGSDEGLTNAEFDQVTAALTGLRSLEFFDTSQLTSVASISNLVELESLNIRNTGVTSVAALIPLSLDKFNSLDLDAIPLADVSEIASLENNNVTITGSPAP
jgi:Leucine-rich repeat (LRR) protein